MVIRLPSTQVSEYWEVIKHCLIAVDEVAEKDRQHYLNQRLQALLSDKEQCFLRMEDERNEDGNRTLIALMVTELTENDNNGKKRLYVRCLFSFKRVSLEVWQKEFPLLLAFAQKTECADITFNSRNPKVWEIALACGFKEQHRSFIYDLGGI